jgi:hypothetical protein
MLFGVSMWLHLKNTLKKERRQTLSRRIDRLEELLAKDQSATSADRFQDFTDFAHATGNGLAEIVHPDGTRAYPSPSAAASAFPWPAVAADDAKLFETVQAAGQSYWVTAWAWRSPSGSQRRTRLSYPSPARWVRERHLPFTSLKRDR